MLDLDEALSIKNVLFKYTLDALNKPICTPKLVLQIIYIILLLVYINMIILSGAYKKGFIPLIGILAWMYINLLYQSKICNISGDLGYRIRVHELLNIMFQYIPYILVLIFLLTISYIADKTNKLAGIAQPFIDAIKESFLLQFLKKNKNLIDDTTTADDDRTIEDNDTITADTDTTTADNDTTTADNDTTTADNDATNYL